MNNTMNKKASAKRPLFDRRGKSGTYAVVMSLILLAVLVVVNMLAASLPSKYTMIDTSSNGQFDISGTTERFISQITEKITFYYVCTKGYEDASLKTFVDRYASMNSNLSVVSIDPVDDPSFLEKYQVTDLNENSIIIESERRVKTVDYYDFFRFYNADMNYYMSYDEYTYYGPTYESYYGYTFTPIQYFDSVLTLGVEYVSASAVPSMYLLNGHGETDFPAVVTTNLDSVGFSYETINLALGESIPEDCTSIVIHNPTADITEAEARTLSAYLADGGNLLLITSNGAEKFKNLASVTKEWGLSAYAGVVNEGKSSSHVSNLPTYIFPTINAEHDATAYVASNSAVLLSNAHAIGITEVSGIKTTELFTTSDKAFISSDGQKSDAGKLVLGAVAEKIEGAGKICWVSSGDYIKEANISSTNYGNFYAFFLMAKWLTGNYTSSLSEIPGVELSEPKVITTATDVNIWGSILIFIIPGAVIGGGVAYCIYRRRR